MTHNVLPDAPRDLAISIFRDNVSGTRVSWGGVRSVQSSFGNEKSGVGEERGGRPNSSCCAPHVLLPSLIFTFLYLFISVSVSISVRFCLCVFLSVSVSISVSILPLSLYFCVSLFLFVSVFILLYLFHCLHFLLSLCVSLGSELHGNTSHLEVQQGQSLRLLCAADSHPPATLSWSLEDRILSRSSPVGSRTLGLELPRVKVGDSGHYTCQAENRQGSQQHTLEISVLCECDPPQAPSSEEGKEGKEGWGTGGLQQSDHQATWVGDPVSDSPTLSFHFWEGCYTQREGPGLPGASSLSSLQIPQRT